MSAPQALPTLLTSRARLREAKQKPCVAQPLNLPEAYTMPVRIRNTFIDTAAERSPSLETFYREREVNTCPSHRIGALTGLFKEAAEEAEPESRAAAAAEARTLVLSLAEAIGMPEVPYVQEQWDAGCWQQPLNGSLITVHEPLGLLTMSHSGASGEPVFEPPPPPNHPALGCPELPSIGSTGHDTGRCKPCAFFHTKGCTSDFACQFCHLCEPEERKRRRKEKIEARRAAHKSRKGGK